MDSNTANTIGLLRSIIAGSLMQNIAPLAAYSACAATTVPAYPARSCPGSRRAFGLPFSQVDQWSSSIPFFPEHRADDTTFFSAIAPVAGTRTGGVNLLQCSVIDWHAIAGKTRADGLVSIAETSCIGMCDHGAALLVNGMPITCLDAGKIDAHRRSD